MKRIIYFILLVLVAISSCKKDSATNAPLYQNTLTVNDNTWTTNSANGYVEGFSNGHYSIKADSVNYFGYALAPYSSISFPYSAQVDGTIQLENPNGVGYIGIIFNFLSNGHYAVFQLANDGYYGLWTTDLGVFTIIAPATFSSFAVTGVGAKNELKIIQNSTTVQLLINGNSVGTYPLALPTNIVESIKAGILAGNVQAGPYFTVTTGLFNNFILTKN